MKHVSTQVSTGTKVNTLHCSGIVGTYKNGLITIQWKVNDTSCISEQYSTRKLNQLIKVNKIFITS